MGAWQLLNFRICQRLSIETVERHESAWNWLTHKGENSAKLKRLASPKEAHEMPTDTHTDAQIQIHSHIVTTATSTTTTFIHAAQETTRRLVNFWIADSQKIQRILRYRYSYSCRYTDTDTSSSLLRWLAWRQFAVISCHVLIVKMSATYARICIYEIHLVSVNRFDWQWSC